MNTERGLKNLEDLLKSTSEGATSSEYLDFVGWSRELRESIEREKRFVGLDQNEQVGRQRILRQLDVLALKHSGKSFLELCWARLPSNANESVEKRSERSPVESELHNEAQLKDQTSDVQAGPVEVFFSYSHRDEELRDELERHLSTLRRQGIIKSWHDRRIGAGREWEGAIDSHLKNAQIILFLVTANLLASDYVYDVELKQAMARHNENKAVVIPIILRPCDWQESPLGKLQALPTDGRAVTTWQDRDEAFLDVTKGIRLVIKERYSKKF
jgi:hypothetical protein